MMIQKIMPSRLPWLRWLRKMCLPVITMNVTAIVVVLFQRTKSTKNGVENGRKSERRKRRRSCSLIQKPWEGSTYQRVLQAVTWHTITPVSHRHHGLWEQMHTTPLNSALRSVRIGFMLCTSSCTFAYSQASIA